MRATRVGARVLLHLSRLRGRSTRQRVGAKRRPMINSARRVGASSNPQVEAPPPHPPPQAGEGAYQRARPERGGKKKPPVPRAPLSHLPPRAPKLREKYRSTATST